MIRLRLPLSILLLLGAALPAGAQPALPLPGAASAVPASPMASAPVPSGATPATLQQQALARCQALSLARERQRCLGRLAQEAHAPAAAAAPRLAN